MAVRNLFFYFAAGLMVFAGCRGSSSLVQPAEDMPADSVGYTIIYMIHGDSDYLYHDGDGNPVRADERIAAEARRVAERAVGGEVFIFHQLPERRIFGLIPDDSRKMIYYRGGEKVSVLDYSSARDNRLFHAEYSLFSRYRAGRSGDDMKGDDTEGDDIKTIFLYFGHEIPDRNGYGYHRSQEMVAVNRQTFAAGLEEFQEGTGKFDLTVLSSCNNGTPGMVRRMQPVTNTLLASAQNLHLSHVDTRPLYLLEENPGISTKRVAEAVASETFRRLDRTVQTEITLSVYDMSRITGAILQQDLSDLFRPPGMVPDRFADNTDCADFHLFRELDYTSGVRLWYRSPRFGSAAGKESHSGWGCRKTANTDSRTTSR